MLLMQCMYSFKLQKHRPFCTDKTSTLSSICIKCTIFCCTLVYMLLLSGNLVSAFKSILFKTKNNLQRSKHLSWNYKLRLLSQITKIFFTVNTISSIRYFLNVNLENKSSFLCLVTFFKTGSSTFFFENFPLIFTGKAFCAQVFE